MRTIRYCMLLVCLMMAVGIQAQAPESVTLSVNSVELAVKHNGIWGNAPDGSSGLWYPAGQREKAMMYTAGLQLAGYLNGELRTASVQYSTEYRPGPILPNGQPADLTDARCGVHQFMKGDAIGQELIDAGCPPEVLGDGMLFTVFNDLTSHENVYTLPPIGIEVQQTVWAYDSAWPLNRTIFMRYRFINKNANGETLTGAYTGIFMDPDLGGANDDASGCDPELNLGYCYNSRNNDAVYGSSAPVLGYQVLKGPEVPDYDSFTKNLGMTAFMAMY